MLNINFTEIDETIEAVVASLVKQTLTRLDLDGEILSNVTKVTLFLNDQHATWLMSKNNIDVLTRLYNTFEHELMFLLLESYYYARRDVRLILEVNGVITYDIKTSIGLDSNNDDLKHSSSVVDISILKGKVISSITTDTNEIDEDDQLTAKEFITFTCTDGTVLTMKHEQDCCEDVEVEDICGDLRDLIGETIVTAESAINSSDEESTEVINQGSFLPVYPTAHTMSDTSETWTFYKLDCIKGSVVIRWLGSSNGCYSESVDMTVTIPRGRGANKKIA